MLDNKNVNKPIHQESKTLLGKMGELDFGALGIGISGLTVYGCYLYPVATATVIGALPYIGIGILGMVTGALLMDAFKEEVVENIEEFSKESNEKLDNELNKLNQKINGCLPVGATKEGGK